MHTLFLGDFETSGQYAMLGLQLWRSLGGQSSIVDLDADAVTLLCYKALFEWNVGETAIFQGDHSGSYRIGEGVE